MVELKNSILTVKISEKGAEIKSVVKDDVERMWQGGPETWNGSAPLLFPICGGLKDGKFIHKGKEYFLRKHGFMMGAMFEVESATDTKAVFFIKSNEETLKSYPFEFELRVIFTLDGASLKIEYKVDNISDETMYFSIGSHEAYYTPTGIERYDVIFEEKETLRASVLSGDYLTYDKVTMLKNSSVYPLYEKYLTNDGLVFTDIKSRSVMLRNRITGRGVKIDFPFADYFLLWHSFEAPFICLEPWAGIPDYIDSDYDITKKPGIISLEKGKTYLGEHTLTFFDEE